MQENNNKLIVVLGMHRSGTSVITRGLQVMGTGLGDRLLPAKEDNSTGFWEDIDINALNIEMLSALGSDWYYLTPIKPGDVEILRKQGYFLRAVELLRQKIGSAPIFGFKDPRVAKLLPFWKEVFSHCKFDVSYILALRNPLSVGKSLAKRDGIDATQSYLLWLGYVVTSLTGSAGDKRVLVDYDRLIQAPEQELIRIAKCTVQEIDPTELQSYKSEFLDQALQHTIYKLNDLSLDEDCPPIVREVYAALLEVASEKTSFDDLELQGKIARWAGEFENIRLPLLLVEKLLIKNMLAKQALTERDCEIAVLNQAVDIRNKHAAERDEHIANLNQAVAERDQHIANFSQAAAERDEHIANFSQAAAERDGHIANLKQAVDILNKHAAERDEHIANLKQSVAEQNGQLADLAQTMHDKEVHISNLNQALAEREQLISNLTQAIDEIRGSTSWRVTRPVRFAGRQLLRTKVILRASPYALSMCGGYRGLARHVWTTYQKEGVNGIKHRILFSASPGAPTPLLDYVQPSHNDYSEWVRCYDTLTDQDREVIKNQISRMHKAPLISVLMPVYNPPLTMLEDAIRSVQGQLYQNWELCIADDASTDKGVHELLQRYANDDSRIKVVFREENGHISAASNSALALVNGEYVALLDNDDLLREHALFWIAETIIANPDAGLIYSDEDKVDQSGRRYDPYFKPDWNPDLFLSHNMICHLGVYRTDLVRELGGFREGYEGAQDYDLALRCTERLASQQIQHIPRVLYHWRSHPGSTAQAGSEKNYAQLAGERALNDHFARVNVLAKAELLSFGMYRACYAISTPAPLVSLIIPTRNGLNLIKQCIESILAKTTYKNYEILIVDNNSDDPDTLDYFAGLAGENRIRIVRDERPFNYSALNNAAVQQARGEYLGLINNDIEVISPDWLDEMMGLAAQPGVGAVGARLWYPNDTLQHGGCITGVGGVTGHSHKHLPRGHFGYFARAQLIQTLSVVTAACLVVKKSIYQEVGGLDETNLTVAFNDVDFCLRVRDAGYRNVWTPYAELYHHESATRGYEDTLEKQLRFRDEVLYMQKRWGDALKNDPAYNPNLTLEREDFSYAWPPRVNPI